MNTIMLISGILILVILGAVALISYWEEEK